MQKWFGSASLHLFYIPCTFHRSLCTHLLVKTSYTCLVPPLLFVALRSRNYILWNRIKGGPGWAKTQPNSLSLSLPLPSTYHTRMGISTSNRPHELWIENKHLTLSKISFKVFLPSMFIESKTIFFDNLNIFSYTIFLVEFFKYKYTEKKQSEKLLPHRIPWPHVAPLKHFSKDTLILN